MKILKIRRTKTFNLIIAWIPITTHAYKGKGKGKGINLI